MPRHLERIDWMPSPPLVPDAAADAPLDAAHLSRMTFGETDLEREVLAMFAAQSLSLLQRLVAMPDDAGALAHTLKGSARAVGAFRVADAAECFERALLDDEPVEQALNALGGEVAQARLAIDDRLRRSRS